MHYQLPAQVAAPESALDASEGSFTKEAHSTAPCTLKNGAGACEQTAVSLITCNAPLPQSSMLVLEAPCTGTFRRCERNDPVCKQAAVGDCRLINIELWGEGPGGSTGPAFADGRFFFVWAGLDFRRRRVQMTLVDRQLWLCMCVCAYVRWRSPRQKPYRSEFDESGR